MGRVNIELDPLVVSDWPGSERVARLQLPSLRGPSRANAAGRTGSSPRLYWPPKGNSSQSCQGPEGPPSSACAAGSQESRHTHERLGRDDRRVRWAPALMGIPLNEPVGVPPDSGARPHPPAIAAASPSPRSASAWEAARGDPPPRQASSAATPPPRCARFRRPSALLRCRARRQGASLERLGPDTHRHMSTRSPAAAGPPQPGPPGNWPSIAAAYPGRLRRPPWCAAPASDALVEESFRAAKGQVGLDRTLISMRRRSTRTPYC